jgi:hypothetical protein
MNISALAAMIAPATVILHSLNPLPWLLRIFRKPQKEIPMSDTSIDPNAAPAEVGATITAPVASPRGLAAVIADVEAAVLKIQNISLQRSVIDAAEAEVRALMVSLKAEYETEKAKIEAFF